MFLEFKPWHHRDWRDLMMGSVGFQSMLLMYPVFTIIITPYEQGPTSADSLFPGEPSAVDFPVLLPFLPSSSRKSLYQQLARPLWPQCVTSFRLAAGLTKHCTFNMQQSRQKNLPGISRTTALYATPSPAVKNMGSLTLRSEKRAVCLKQVLMWVICWKWDASLDCGVVVWEVAPLFSMQMLHCTDNIPCWFRGRIELVLMALWHPPHPQVFHSPLEPPFTSADGSPGNLSAVPRPAAAALRSLIL